MVSNSNQLIRLIGQLNVNQGVYLAKKDSDLVLQKTPSKEALKLNFEEIVTLIEISARNQLNYKEAQVLLHFLGISIQRREIKLAQKNIVVKLIVNLWEIIQNIFGESAPELAKKLCEKFSKIQPITIHIKPPVAINPTLIEAKDSFIQEYRQASVLTITSSSSEEQDLQEKEEKDSELIPDVVSEMGDEDVPSFETHLDEVIIPEEGFIPQPTPFILDESSLDLEEEKPKEKDTVETSIVVQTLELETPKQEVGPIERPKLTRTNTVKNIHAENYRKDPEKCKSISKSILFKGINAIQAKGPLTSDIKTFQHLLDYLNPDSEIIDLNLPHNQRAVLDMYLFSNVDHADELSSWLITQDTFSSKLLYRCLKKINKKVEDGQPLCLYSVILLLRFYFKKEMTEIKIPTSRAFVSTMALLLKDNYQNNDVIELTENFYRHASFNLNSFKVWMSVFALKDQNLQIVNKVRDEMLAIYLRENWVIEGEDESSINLRNYMQKLQQPVSTKPAEERRRNWKVFSESEKGNSRRLLTRANTQGTLGHNKAIVAFKSHYLQETPIKEKDLKIVFEDVNKSEMGKKLEALKSLIQFVTGEEKVDLSDSVVLKILNGAFQYLDNPSKELCIDWVLEDPTFTLKTFELLSDYYASIVDKLTYLNSYGLQKLIQFYREQNFPELSLSFIQVFKLQLKVKPNDSEQYLDWLLDHENFTSEIWKNLLLVFFEKTEIHKEKALAKNKRHSEVIYGALNQLRNYYIDHQTDLDSLLSKDLQLFAQGAL